MKKHLTPYLLVFLLILVLSGGAFYITKKYNLAKEGSDSASIFATKPVVVSQGYRFVDVNNGDGTCWRGTYQDDGTPIGLYKGTWAAGTGECRLAISTAPQRPKTVTLSSTGGSTTFTVTSGEDYFRNETNMQLLQLKLNQAGVLDSSKITGTFTPDTFLAIKAYQAKNKLPETGYPNAATVKLLNAAPFTSAISGATTPSTLTR